MEIIEADRLNRIFLRWLVDYQHQMNGKSQFRRVGNISKFDRRVRDSFVGLDFEHWLNKHNLKTVEIRKNELCIVAKSSIDLVSFLLVNE